MKTEERAQLFVLKQDGFSRVKNRQNIFFNLEKRNYNHKTIKKLNNPDGKSVAKEEEILEEIERFYKELYTSTTSFENTQFISYIENLELLRLEDSASSELEGDITLKERKDILFTSGRGFF